MRTTAERQAEAARHRQLTEASACNGQPKVFTVESLDRTLALKHVSVVLHTEAGDVTTSYGPGCSSHAASLVQQYLQDGKNFTVRQSSW